MNYYRYVESERSYVEEFVAYKLNSYYTGCNPGGFKNYEAHCPLKQITDGTVIRINRYCRSSFDYTDVY